VGDTSLRIPLQQRLAVWHVRRVAGVIDGDPEGTNYDDPCHRRPARVGEQANEAVLEASVEDAAVGREDDRGNTEVDVRDVEPGEVVEKDDTKTPGDGSAGHGVAFV
jgi:hypothetical protein